MDLMSMLPLLMAMNGGGNKNASAGIDMQTMLKLMSAMSGNGSGADPMGAFRNMFNNGQSRSDGGNYRNNARTEHVTPDMKDVYGMLSPEMITLLASLAAKR